MIPCKVCGTPTNMLGTKLCTPCWEITHRLDDFARSERGRSVLLQTIFVSDLRMEQEGWESEGRQAPTRRRICPYCSQDTKQYFGSDFHWHMVWHLDPHNDPCEYVVGKKNEK